MHTKPNQSILTLRNPDFYLTKHVNLNFCTPHQSIPIHPSICPTRFPDQHSRGQPYINFTVSFLRETQFISSHHSFALFHFTSTPSRRTPDSVPTDPKPRLLSLLILTKRCKPPHSTESRRLHSVQAASPKATTISQPDRQTNKESLRLPSFGQQVHQSIIDRPQLLQHPHDIHTTSTQHPHNIHTISTQYHTIQTRHQDTAHVHGEKIPLL
ncbi:hypothetical protein BKA65DRAFT_489205 [Rhexocercosporidium sp. MPI-PUGE-AT-0058]|nr:hypothetical protein BKA65DRAFT_489205 [Rhexocercosporidium sp. MPI-PUGE-AT-0058]